ncbi:MAG: DinB family protein [Gemmatimonadota bacterium]
MMSATDRSSVVAALEANLRHLERLIAHVDPATATTKPAAEAWSVVEVIEHLAVVERGVHKAVAAAAGAPASELRTREKDARIAGAATFPGALTAPEPVTPTGRFASLEEASRFLRERRTATLDLARSLDVPWDAHHAPHPIFGMIDVGQWFLFAATHGERHAAQLERR